jgi:4-hydroxy-3-methylbut-2-enyl diphosphate reductase IspH
MSGIKLFIMLELLRILTAKGAIFIEELDEVPPNATLIFSAHGVSETIRQEAIRRGFRIFDATCPLVNKVHVEVAKFHKDGTTVLMIGHAGHPEVIGTMGQIDSRYLFNRIGCRRACFGYFARYPISLCYTNNFVD